jgi:hypothetical protein
MSAYGAGARPENIGQNHKIRHDAWLMHHAQAIFGVKDYPDSPSSESFSFDNVTGYLLRLGNIVTS